MSQLNGTTRSHTRSSTRFFLFCRFPLVSGCHLSAPLTTMHMADHARSCESQKHVNNRRVVVVEEEEIQRGNKKGITKMKWEREREEWQTTTPISTIHVCESYPETHRDLVNHLIFHSFHSLGPCANAHIIVLDRINCILGRRECPQTDHGHKGFHTLGVFSHAMAHHIWMRGTANCLQQRNLCVIPVPGHTPHTHTHTHTQRERENKKRVVVVNHCNKNQGGLEF